MLHELCVTPEALVGFIETQEDENWATSILDHIFDCSVWCWDHDSPRWKKIEQIDHRLRRASSNLHMSYMMTRLLPRLKRAQLPPLPQGATELQNEEEMKQWYLDHVFQAPNCHVVHGHREVRDLLDPFLRHSSWFVVRDSFLLRSTDDESAILCSLLELCKTHKISQLELHTSLCSPGENLSSPSAKRRRLSFIQNAREQISCALMRHPEHESTDIRVFLGLRGAQSQHTRLAEFGSDDSSTSHAIMIEPGFKAILEDFNHSATIAWYRGDRGRRSADRLLQDWDARWDLDLHAKRRGSKVQFSAKRRGDLPIEPVDLPANEHVWDVATRQLLELPAVDAS